jgi:DDE_Tnp_1-associated
VLSSTAAASADVQVQVPDCGRLLELLGMIPDPRCRRGIRHTLAGITAIAAAAVLADCQSLLLVGEWAADAPQELVAALDARRSADTGQYVTDAGAVHLLATDHHSATAVARRDTARYLVED